MLITFGFFNPSELVIILVIALIIFGPGKLPDVGKSLGRGIKEFKEATRDNPTPGPKEEEAIREN